MAGSQIPTSVTIIDSLHGFMGLSLTEYATSAAAAIAAGSVVEVAGSFFTFVSDDTPEASTWTSITTGTTAYIALTPSGTAGSQILSATYTATAPTWRDDLQGWYASAASSTRVVASVYKAEATSYYPKYILAKDQELSFSGGMRVRGVLSVSSSISVVGGATVGSHLTAVSMAVSSSMSVGENINIEGSIRAYRHDPYLEIHESAYTASLVFNAMENLIPVTGNTMIVSGAFNGVIVSRAIRSSSTIITIYGAPISGSAPTTYAITDGSASAFTNISIAG